MFYFKIDNHLGLQLYPLHGSPPCCSKESTRRNWCCRWSRSSTNLCSSSFPSLWFVNHIDTEDIYLQSSKQLKPYLRRPCVGVCLCLWVRWREINVQRVLNFWFISDLPHRLMEDDVYKDMHIPKGSLVFGNVWYVTLLIFCFGVPWLAALCFDSFNHPLCSSHTPCIQGNDAQWNDISGCCLFPSWTVHGTNNTWDGTQDESKEFCVWVW